MSCLTALALERGKPCAVLPIAALAERHRGWLLASTFIAISDEVSMEHWRQVAERFTYRRNNKDNPIVRAYRDRVGVLYASAPSQITVARIREENFRYYDAVTCPGSGSYRNTPRLARQRVSVLTVPRDGFPSDMAIEELSLDLRDIAKAVVQLLPSLTLPKTEPLGYPELKWCMRRDYTAEAGVFAGLVQGPR